MNLPVIILGGGGHARVLIDTLLLLGKRILGFTEIAKDSCLVIRGIPMLGDDEAVLRYRPEAVRLVNGLGCIKPSNKRKFIYEHFKDLGYNFTSVIHPSSVISTDVRMGEGVQIMAGAIIQPGTRLGINSIVNTRASVDHDCYIENHAHLAPGVTLSGMVQVGRETHIGTGATVIQGVKIGSKCLIGAGSLVLKDIPVGVTAYGLPAIHISSSD
ncbi:MAG: acetyltransferase [Firmicutes bacterium]|nr:acetyltransferase [Bacillota bacterium]